MQPFSAIVLCAGQGTRMRSTKAKVLHDLAGRPLGYYPIRTALDAGAARVIVVVGHQADEVKASLLAALGKERRLSFVLQKAQDGTAHAVRCAESSLKRFRDPVAILYGDVPLLRVATVHMLLQCRAVPGRVLALTTAHAPDPSGYGRIVRNPEGVLRIVEDKDCDDTERAIDEINAGIYAVSADFLWSMLGKVQADNAQREFYLTDLAEAASALAAPGVAVTTPFHEVTGVNDRADLARVGTSLRERINLRHLGAGVTIADPATTYIDDTVKIGADSSIAPGVALRGTTVVGKGVSIEVGCVVIDSRVADGVSLRPYCVLEKADIGNGCLVGPFARLRPGTVLARNVHIGNFVETKNAELGTGTKANHLSYLGDAIIGQGVNVGAGTITCNYDGVNKHTTRLGNRVFVGSDTQFVAPVTVGNGAYIAAGSTIVEDVPAGALGIARGRQTVKPGWAKKNAARRAKAAKGRPKPRS